MEKLQKLAETKYTKKQLRNMLSSLPDSTFENLYAEYKKLRTKFVKQQKSQNDLSAYNNYHKLKTPENLTNITGFRSKIKNEYLNIDPNHRDLVPDGFHLEKQKKSYMCHLIYPEGTFFMDIMFTGNKQYLLFLEFLTRYLYVEPLASKFTTHVSDALEKILRRNNLIGKVKVIRSDAESAFKSYQMETQLLKPYNIKLKIIDRDYLYKNATHIAHDKLGVIDRVTKTLRDMAYVAGVPDPIPENVMAHLVNMYNQAPHTFLSKYYGELISPAEVDEQAKLIIWRRVQQENYNISRRSGFYIKPGKLVAVYNDDDKHKKRQQVRPQFYKVLGYRNGGYDLQDENGDEINVSRFRIKTIKTD